MICTKRKIASRRSLRSPISRFDQATAFRFSASPEHTQCTEASGEKWKRAWEWRFIRRNIHIIEGVCRPKISKHNCYSTFQALLLTSIKSMGRSQTLISVKSTSCKNNLVRQLSLLPAPSWHLIQRKRHGNDRSGRYA